MSATPERFFDSPHLQTSYDTMMDHPAQYRAFTLVTVMILALFAADLLVSELPAAVSEICQAARTNAEALAVAPELTAETGPKEIIVDQVRIVADRHVLRAYTRRNDADDVVSVKQEDFGEIIGIFLDRTGYVVAIGDETSYRIQVGTDDQQKARFIARQELPTLFREKCQLTRYVFGACQPSQTFFSQELKATFVSGYDINGIEWSYAYGLMADGETELRDQNGDWLHYMADIVGSGGALFQIRPHEVYFFKGNSLYRCDSRIDQHG